MTDRKDELRPLASTIPALVDLRASQCPSKIFIEAAVEGTSITYDEFRTLNVASSAALRSVGVTARHRVAFFSPNSLSYILLLFGVQRIGATPMPINTALPLDTLTALLKVGKCNALVTSKELNSAAICQTLPDLTMIFLEDYPVAHLRSLRAPSQDLACRADDIALILHTSGTLKQPKLVPLTHRNLLMNREAVRQHWQGLLTEESATLGWMPFYHVIGLAQDFIGQLYIGGRYLMAHLPRGQPATAALLAELLISARPTIFYCVPWILDQMRPIVAANAALLRVLRNLKLLMSGGVALSGPLAAFFFDNEIPLVDGLGMTDTAGAIFLGDPRVGQGNLRLLRGLSSEFVPVEGLAAMELRFRAGPCITSGYLNDAEANAACFIDEHVFRTFDLFESVDPELQTYRYCGRIDDIFALEGGEKANPLPIEQGLAECCQLISRVALLGNRRAFLVVVIEPRPQATAAHTAESLEHTIWQAIQTCNSSLPVYARIRRSAVIILPTGTSIPVTPKGSVKRSELEKHMQARLEAIYSAATDLSQYDPIRAWFTEAARDASQLSLRTVVEALKRILERLLDLSAISVSDLSGAFAALGVDSQRAVLLTSAASHTFGIQLKATLVFQHSSPSELAMYIYRALTSQRLDITSRVLNSASQKQGSAIAVTGYAFKFPGGASSSESLWSLLSSGRNAISDPPVSRSALHNVHLTKGAYTLRAGYLSEDLSMFDNRLFRISEQESCHLDPQQRLLLELAWEALEQAFLGSAARRRHLRIGVWVGLSSHDFELQLLRRAQVERFTATGSSFATAAGRMAYSFDLKGPCVTVDTACSSSLVATHLARQALLAGQVDVAVVGSASVIIAPEPWLAACKARLLSPTGVCHAFDAAADGYVRAEGAAVVVLRPLERALEASDTIHGSVVGSAVNQDGQSNGFTAPQGSAQEEVIGLALRDGGLAPTDVQLVETHGTGTALGDPVELDALCAAYGPRAQPLLLGALKSVTGHMEACAGLGGLIKTLISMQRQALPPHPHFKKLNSLASSPSSVVIPTATHAWLSQCNAERRRAGISSFGISGTNSHIIIEEPPRVCALQKTAVKSSRARHLFAVSAASPVALQSLLGALRASPVLQQSTLADVCYTLATTRAELPYRWTATAATAAELQTLLAAPLDNPRPTRGRKVAFLFPGQGTLQPGLGRELYTSETVFRSCMDECSEILLPALGFSLVDKLYNSAEPMLVSATLTQCTLLSIGASLARLLASWGIAPDAVLGHSSGELTAAHVAGLLSLKDAVCFAAMRGRFMDQAAVARPGAMIAIFASRADVESIVRSSEQETLLAIAAHNGPNHTVVSGERAAVDKIVALATERGLKFKLLAGVATAFHSPLLDPILEDFERAVREQVEFGGLRMPFVSSATGRFEHTERLSSASHWRAQLRGAVLYNEAMQVLHDDGVTVWIELGSRATLIGLLRRALPSTDDTLLLPCLAVSDGASDTEALMSTVGSLWRAGLPVDHAAMHAPFKPNLVANLPTYCFDRRSFWFTDTAPAISAVGITPSATSSSSEIVFGTEEPYTLQDHLVHSRVVIPGAAHLLYLAQAAAPRSLSLASVSFLQAVLIDEPPCKVIYRLHDRTSATVETNNGGQTVTHVECKLVPSSSLEPTTTSFPVVTAPPRIADEFYAYALDRQLHCGPQFRWMKTSSRIDELSANVVLDQPTQERRTALTAGFMDCVLQASWFVFSATERTLLHLPVAVGSAAFASDFQVLLPATVYAHRLVEADKEGVRVDLAVTGNDGAIAVRLCGVVFRRFVLSSFLRSTPSTSHSIYEVQQMPEPLPASPTATTMAVWSIVTSDATSADLCVSLLRQYPNFFEREKQQHPRVLFLAPNLGMPADQWRAFLSQYALQIRDAIVNLVNAHLSSHFVLVSGGGSTVLEHAIAALLRTAGLEFPSVTVRHISVPLFNSHGINERLVQELLAGSANRVMYSNALERAVPRLQLSAVASPTSFKPLTQGTYILTGAYGGIGQLLCSLLFEAGASRLLLVGRRPSLDHAPPAHCEHLCDSVMDVTSTHVDSVVGVVHCASSTADASLMRMSLSEVSRVLHAKFEGAWHLHSLSARLTPGRLRHFILFSSIASVLGSAGQAAYAMANGALDGIAAVRHEARLPVTCLNWGPWRGVGMAKRLTGNAVEGVHSFSVLEASALLTTAFASGAPRLVLIRAQWANTVWAKRTPDTLRDLLVSAPTVPLASAALSTDARSIVLAIVALVKGASQVARADETFASLGVDSLMAIELRDALATTFSTPLPGSLVYDRPTIRLCAEHIRSLLPSLASLVASPLASNISTIASDEDIAVIGYTCRFPGDANDLSSLWHLLAVGTDAISPAPPAGRWAQDWSSRMTSTRGGFLRDVELFDAPFFGISPREARLLDPQQRLLLELAWEALERSAQLPLRDSHVGVWVGVSSHDYEALVRRSAECGDPYFATGNGHSVCSGRLSYFFGLTGPSMSIDTACSSSLVGVHLARRSLLAGECSMALVGGVNLILQPELSAAFSAAGMLSPEGRCRTFDASASGYVRSEGAAVVLLKRLSDAMTAGDEILGVIKGSATNQDGRSNGLTAPSGPAQSAVIRRALMSASLSTNDISYIEAHGTGTVLGDAVELGALTEVFRPEQRQSALQLGSTKCNLGHTEAAAGLAALGKVLCMLKERHIPPHLHLTRPNPALGRGLGLSTSLRQWQAHVLRAGVSSFGFSGTNAHLIVQEHIASPSRLPTNNTSVLPLVLSAHSPKSLVALGHAMVDYLASCNPGVWSALSYTLACRRQRFAHCIYVTASNAAEARTALVRALREPQAATVPSTPALALVLGEVPQPTEEFRVHIEAVQKIAESDAMLVALQWQAFACQYAAACVILQAAPPDIAYAMSGHSFAALAAAVGALSVRDALVVALRKTAPATSQQSCVPLGLVGDASPVSAQTLTSVDFWRSQFASSVSVDVITIAATGATVLFVGNHAAVPAAKSVLTLDFSAPPRALCAALATLWLAGRRVDWRALFAELPLPLFDLPTYPFDRTRHWVDAAPFAAPPVPHTAVVLEHSTNVQVLLSVVLAELQRLLRMPTVSSTRQLTELGFDSIMALELIECLARRTGRRIKLDALFCRPNAHAIAELLASAELQSIPILSARSIPAVKFDKPESFPITPLQRSYFMAAADPTQPSCHLYLEYEFTGDLDCLEAAWNALIARHEMLRVVFTDDAEQRALPAVQRYVIASVPAAELPTAQIEMRQQKFDPHKWPLFDVRAGVQKDGGHLLLVSLDFLIFDLASLSLLFLEWRQLYVNINVQLPPIGTTFREFVAAAAERVDPAAEAYWSARMEEFPDGPRLARVPLKSRSPPVFVHLEHSIDSATWATAQTRLRTRGLTPAAALLGCYAAVLNAWTADASYSVVATLFRPPAGSRHLIGDFSTTLLFVVDAAWRTHTLAHLLAAVQGRWLADLSNSAVEGPALMQRLAKARGRTPEMPVVFTMAAKDQERYDWDAWLGVRRTRVSQTPHVLLDCQVHETGAGELVVAWDHVAEAFPKGMLGDMFDAFTALIASLATEESWASLPRVLPSAHLALYEQVNHTSKDLGNADELLHEPFYRTAASTPDAPCVLTANAELTYGQVASLSIALCNRLRMSTSSRIGILLPKGWQQVVAVLGILRAGMVFIPLDVHWPEDRLRLVASLASLAAIVSSSVHKPTWFTTGVILIDSCKDEPAIAAVAPPRLPSSSAAYVIFTSGSTGQPKGVEIAHQGALNTIRDVNGRFKVTTADCVFGLSELHFDLSIWDIFGTFAVGARLAIAPPESKRDPTAWLALALRHKVTIWNSVPRLAELLAEEQDATPVQHLIRLFMMSGDWIPLSLPAKLRRSFGNVELIAMGGATEASIWSVLYPIPRELPLGIPSILYGKAMINQSLHVLDANMHETPLFVPGELFIGGIGVAIKYLDPVHTAKSFLVHPRLGRLYRTGDNARWLLDGNMEFMGRRDTQTKLAGVRIELGEVESAAHSANDVKNAVALVKNDVLVLHYVGAAEPATVRARLAARLPPALCPSLVLRVTAIPLTSNGKVDRAALLAASTPQAAKQSISAKGEEPTSTAQQQVLKEWRELLATPVTLDSNVFAAGATSLSIIRLATRLRRLGAPVAAAALLKLATPREQAALLESVATSATPPLEAMFIVPSTRPSPVRASFAQQHAWFAEQLHGDNRMNTVALAIDIVGESSVPALCSALRLVVQRHEALRTSLEECDGRLYLCPVVSLLELQEHAASTTKEMEDKLEELAAVRWRYGKCELPIRAHLVHTTEFAVLLLVLHHAAVDGWSSAIVSKELSVAYASFCTGGTPSLSSSAAIQHADFASWEQAQNTAPRAFAQHLPYWKSQLASSPAASFPVVGAAPASGSMHLVFNRSFVGAAKSLAASTSASVFTVLLSIFVTLLYRRTGQHEFVIGTVTPCRTASPQLEDAVGCFINMIPLVCRPGSATSMAVLIARMTDTWRAALAHEVPLHYLRQQLGFSDSPFRILFIQQNAAVLPALHGCSVTRRHVFVPATEFDMTMSLEEIASGDMEIALEYASTALTHSSAQRFCEDFTATLACVHANTQLTPSAVRTFASDRGEAAQTLAVRAVCSTVLGLPVGAFDSFAGLGLSDAQRMSLLAALRRDAIPNLQYRQLHDALCPAALAPLVPDAMK